MGESKKEIGLKRAKGLLKKIVKLPHGEVKIHPEDDAIKALMRAGYTESEAWGEVVEELEELQLKYGSSPVMGVSPKRVSEAYRNVDKFEEYNLSGERSKLGKNINQYLGVVSAAFLGGSALLFTPSITGNVIWGLAPGDTNMFGVVFFVLGAAGLLFVLKQK